MKIAAFARFRFMPRSGKYIYLLLREGGGWNPERDKLQEFQHPSKVSLSFWPRCGGVLTSLGIKN